MGTCFGRYSCSCCNCLYLKQPRSSTISSLTSTCRSRSKANSSFALHRQNSTLEFENFMYDYSLEDSATTSTSVRHQPSISTVVRFDAENAKLDNFKLPVYSKCNGKLMLNYGVNYNNRGESPLLDPILLNNCDSLAIERVNPLSTGKSLKNKRLIKKERKRMKDEEDEEDQNDERHEEPNRPFVQTGSHLLPMLMKVEDSSYNNWDHESSDVINGGNELEWDDYQDTLIFNDETDSLIQDIEDLTARALKETGLN